jgi:hypothetical protein
MMKLSCSDKLIHDSEIDDDIDARLKSDCSPIHCERLPHLPDPLPATTITLSLGSNFLFVSLLFQISFQIP